MMWNRIIWLFILFFLGKHFCFPSSPRYLELADSADFFIAKENWNKAEDKILEALRLEPANFSNSLLLANLGLIQTQKKDFEKALQSLTLGLNISPSSTVLLNNRAHAYLLVDSIDAAVKDLDKSLKIDSIQDWTLQTRAFIFLKEGDYKKAHQLFTTYNSNFKPNSSIYAGLAAVAEQEPDLAQAEEYYLKALECDPKDEETVEAFIFFLIRNNEYSKARVRIKDALTNNPDNPTLYLLRGYLHRLNYRLDEALADKKIAIAKGMDPQYASKFIP